MGHSMLNYLGSLLSEVMLAAPSSDSFGAEANVDSPIVQDKSRSFRAAECDSSR